MFDAGSITYLGLRGMAQAFDWTLTVVACFYLGLAIVCFGGAAYFWTIVEPESEISAKLDATTEQESRDSERKPTFESKNSAEVSIESSNDPGKGNASIEEKDQAVIETESGYVLVAERTQIQQIFSGPFLLTLFYATFMITANQWTLTTTRAFLGHIGDDEVDNKYLTIFTLLFPASLAALPFTDAITARYGFHGGFQAVNILAIGYSLIRVLSDDLNVQILGFVLFSFFRSFLFGVTFSAVPVFLSPDVVGKAMGIIYAVAGLVSFVNIPLSRFAIEEKDGDLFIPNLFYTCLIGPCMVASRMLANTIDKESKIKEKRKR
uniref:Major facilitator superfamily (MFS) profile domain-containing protein n=1 Tax=Amphora coffeiformis TaxID=265554 RepID=A0A7S3L6V3_9STRA